MHNFCTYTIKGHFTAAANDYHKSMLLQWPITSLCITNRIESKKKRRQSMS